MKTKREIARERGKEWDRKHGAKYQRAGYQIGLWGTRLLICVLVALGLAGFLVLMVWANGE